MEPDLRRALDEIRRLHACLNDLISVQVLPAIWSRLGTTEIVNTLATKSEGPRELLVASQNGGQDQIVIQVRDSGIGIDPGLLQQIFPRFVTSKPDEMELGLSLSRTIVEPHGGRLWAERNLGPSATFRFFLLAAEAVS